MSTALRSRHEFTLEAAVYDGNIGHSMKGLDCSELKLQDDVVHTPM